MSLVFVGGVVVGAVASTAVRRGLDRAGSQVLGCCPECGRECSQAFRFCPRCGHPDPTGDYEPVSIEDADEMEDYRTKKKLIGTILRLRNRGHTYREIAERVPEDVEEIRGWHEEYREGPEQHDWVREVQENGGHLLPGE